MKGEKFVEKFGFDINFLQHQSRNFSDAPRMQY